MVGGEGAGRVRGRRSIQILKTADKNFNVFKKITVEMDKTDERMENLIRKLESI